MIFHFHQFANRVFAVPCDPARSSLYNAEYFAVHHQHPEVISFNMLFHDDVFRMLDGMGISRANRRVIFQKSPNADATFQICGFHNDWIANLLRDRYRLDFGPYGSLQRYRQASCAQHIAGLLFVLGDHDGNVGCAICYRAMQQP